MNDLDKKIRQALRSEDAELFEELGEEQNLREMVIDTFRGRNRWIVFLVFPSMAVFMALAIFTGVRFFQVETERELIAYAGGFGFSILTISLLKVWYWMELNKNAVTREVKRLELQIARLAKRLGKES